MVNRLRSRGCSYSRRSMVWEWQSTVGRAAISSSSRWRNVFSGIAAKPTMTRRAEGRRLGNRPPHSHDPIAVLVQQLRGPGLERGLVERAEIYVRLNGSTGAVEQR